jgi:uncharacterized protein (DUF1800 family)
MMQAEIAVLRFGLGARPGDLAAAAAEPRAWLMAQRLWPPIHRSLLQMKFSQLSWRRANNAGKCVGIRPHRPPMRW